MTPLPSLVVFGPLTAWPSVEDLHRLRAELSHRTLLAPIHETIRNLDTLWSEMCQIESELDTLPGQRAARQLSEFFDGNSSDGLIREESRNMITVPLTVIAHITQYMSFLEGNGQPIDHGAVLGSANFVGVQGLCVGLLSAVAVSSAMTKDEVVKLAASAIEIGFCIGAFVDLDQRNATEGTLYANLAVRWKSPMTLQSLRRFLRSYEGTYISVIRDVQDVTITTPASHAAALQRGLTREGLSAMDIGLRGRYHSPAYESVLQKILTICKSGVHPHFGRDGKARASGDRSIINTTECLSQVVRSILVEQSNWAQKVSSAISTVQKNIADPWILSIGADALPRFATKRVSVIKFRGILSAPEEIPRLMATADEETKITNNLYPDDAIAVIGMSCKFPGADSVDEFWDLLSRGTSMLSKMPEDRFERKDLPRNAKGNLPFWGNFINDIAAFDHKFFKKSTREAASMDPQQRLLLEVTYQALESSGYFSTSESDPNVGCYIGACSVDYDGNVGSHPPTAYSTTGTLRAFLSGRLSHYFGWQGPSLTFDTACSSSAVAIHTACAALRAGDCNQAIAGGVTIFTTPYLYENLTAAHFLSPTGATKPFDAAADGYCRGEGVGLVVLKTLNHAIRDGDNILGVVAGSGINQNANCVSITVPHSQSQATLYERVARQAGVEPQNVSFVEAHGTGTPVGDPIEMESIRKVFGSPHRDSNLFVSSVKGNIGHLEGASGIAAVIKALLQMRYRTACKQASFQSLNPKIPALQNDKLCIPTANETITASPIVAFINNYGAAGSNAAIVLIEPPTVSSQTLQTKDEIVDKSTRVPIHIAASSQSSLLKYSETLANYCRRETSKAHDPRLHESIAYSLSRQQNQDLSLFSIASVSSVDELVTALSSFTPSERPKQPPLVFCFGGQVGQQVGLDKDLFDAMQPLRSQLNLCNDELESMGFPSIYPAIFQTTPIGDVVVLQSAIFSLQYASARCWLNSSLKVDGVIGHSLGQFAAMCISGILSLRDGLRLVAGRASLMKTHWGVESGSMIAVEGDPSIIERLIRDLETSDRTCSYEVACYNSSTSRVVVSDRVSADALEIRLKSQSIKHKRLHVTHGFHSKFTDPLIPHLEALALDLTINKPKIPLETCTPTSGLTTLTPAAIAAHTREPVYFGEAVQRLYSRLGGCTFLECGSHSGIVGMISRNLKKSGEAINSIPMEHNMPNALDLLADKTTKLWSLGHKVQYWSHQHPSSSNCYVLSLPPYKFDKAKHWIPYETPAPKEVIVHERKDGPRLPPLPLALIRLNRSDDNAHYFDIDPTSNEFRELVAGHVVSGKRACPTSAYLEMAARAVAAIDNINTEAHLYVHGLEYHSFLDLYEDRLISLTLEPSGEAWTFIVSSQCDIGERPPVSHVTGSISFRPSTPERSTEFSRYARIANHDGISVVLKDPRSTSLAGNVAYNIMAPMISYADLYRNIERIASYDNKVVARVRTPRRPHCLDDTILRSYLLQSFLQVASLHVNFLRDSRNELYVEGQVDMIQMGPDYHKSPTIAALEEFWDVLCIASSIDGELTYDIFAYATSPARLAVVISGARYIPAAKDPTHTHAAQTHPSFEKVEAACSSHSDSMTRAVTVAQHSLHSKVVTSQATTTPMAVFHTTKEPQTSIFEDLCTILEKIAEVPRKDVRSRATFDDLGVDSLMMIEVIDEISSFFKLDLPVEDLEQLEDMESLEQYLKGRLAKLSDDGFDTDSAGNATLNSPASSTYETSIDTSLGPALQLSEPPHTITKDLMMLVSEHLGCGGELKPQTYLADVGLDSQICVELVADVEKQFGVKIKPETLNERCSFLDILRIVTGQEEGGTLPQLDVAPSNPVSNSTLPPLLGAQAAFDTVRLDFDAHSNTTGFKNFWKNVYGDQARLVEAYIVEAYRSLGVDLAALQAGAAVPDLGPFPNHLNLVKQFLKILADGGIVSKRPDGLYERTSNAIDETPSTTLYAAMLAKYSEHTSETRLLDITGSRLAECLTGELNALQLLFANKVNRAIMADVYEKAPMCQATTRLLADFLVKTFSSPQPRRTFKLLEVGAGTGGTAKYVIDFLTKAGIDFHYTFTDISSSLVTQAKRIFSNNPRMSFSTLDCDQAPQADLCGQFDAVIATNCIHATQNVTRSATNIAPLLRQGGALCLVEFTQGLYWFDLVYGLLEGWWAFSDGRQHALADEWFWEASLRNAGFRHVSWTEGNSKESQTIRLICGFREDAENDISKPLARGIIKRAGFPVETFTWKEVGALELKADIYFPKRADEPGKQRKIALMVHGGGHLLFSRQDIPMKHIRVLLQRGYLPVSVDYRLCPEVSLFEGPVTDCCDALKWARNTLPKLKLTGPAVRIVPDKLLALGWSSGGQLAMTLGYTAPARGIKAPDVILPFYSPSDLEAEFWDQPIYPAAAEEEPTEIWGELDCVLPSPILKYTPMSNKRASALSLTLNDDRARLILHMNWKAQSVPVLISGLPHKSRVAPSDKTDWKNLPKPSVEAIRQCSPYWHITQGTYQTPTFMVHGNADDWIPYQMTERTVAALRQRGIAAGICIPDQCGHAFDLFPKEDKLGVGWAAIEEAYNFADAEIERA
ncbi:hypothetical protein LLEC1_04192 [Akanthomyces lecanii]|uniref:Uncharacterized protein n=1 Tax=Cordyceps confragosa TaxID=2714763 RepID=A0A179IJ81_CORDF|nr:hypothetical protein LLEC1_04192 [Akanthomyces lecanii]